MESLSSTVSNVAASSLESGKTILTAVGEGIKSAMKEPYRAAKSALSFVRDLLPFSDAKEGPLAGLTRSGVALIETLTAGITKAASLPEKAMANAFGFVNGLAGRLAAPAMVAGTLALTPVMAGEMPAVASSVERADETYSAVPFSRFPKARVRDARLGSFGIVYPWDNEKGDLG